MIREFVSEIRARADILASMIESPPEKRLDQYKAHIGDLMISLRRIARGLST